MALSILKNHVAYPRNYRYKYPDYPPDSRRYFQSFLHITHAPFIRERVNLATRSTTKRIVYSGRNMYLYCMEFLI